MKSTTESPRVKFIIANGRAEKLVKEYDGFWHDRFGTMYAFQDDNLSADKEVRAGIGWFSLSGYEAEVRAHDFAYSCPVYQAFNSRLEADEMLKQHMRGRLLQRPFYWISRIVGWVFWESPKTK